MPPPLRAAAFVVSDAHVVLIGRDDADGATWYEVPGGGVEDGETVEEACLRELWEETGLRGTIVQKLATVRRAGQEQHYFLVSVEDVDFSISQGPEHTDPGYVVGRFEPTWVPVADLSTVAVWPKKLCTLVAEWHPEWPADPVDLDDEEMALDG